jgi:hypothetical protein
VFLRCALLLSACSPVCLQGRAIATFASRRQAHDAIRRLHGKETLAGARQGVSVLTAQAPVHCSLPGSHLPWCLNLMSTPCAQVLLGSLRLV